jgi:hypothetical protein
MIGFRGCWEKSNSEIRLPSTFAFSRTSGRGSGRPSLFDPGDPAAIANAREALAPADELYDLGIAPPRALHVGEMARESDAVDRP